jgi:hypothetical protein
MDVLFMLTMLLRELEVFVLVGAAMVVVATVRIMGTELAVATVKTMGMELVVAIAKMMGMQVVVATVRVWVLGMMEHLRAQAQAELKMTLAMMIMLATWARDTRPFFLEHFCIEWS